MNINKVAVATITWARDAQEEQLLRASLQYLAKLEIPVFITDGGSNSSFLRFLAEFPHFQVSQAATKGVWAQARSSLQAAYQSGAAFILYTEPDKQNFFQHALPRFIAAAPEHDPVGVVLAARSEAGFATFPTFQRTTETTINQCCAEIMGHPIDYTYGPFLLNRNLVPYLSLVQEDIGWGWRPYTFGVAHRLNYEVTYSVEDFACPEEQREDTPLERIYRMRQLSQNIQGLVLSTSVKLS